MSRICESCLEADIQASVNAVTATALAENYVFAAAAINVFDPVNRISTVATVDNLPDLATTVVSTGTMIYVDNLGVPVIANNNCWIGLDGRPLLGSVNRAWTWGQNTFCQLGDGSTTNRSSPVTTSGGGNTWCQISAGSCHTAAVRNSGQLWTWGSNCCGRTGRGVATGNIAPGAICITGTAVAAADWVVVSAGVQHTAAIKQNGTAWAWGNNSLGQLGDTTVTLRSTPVATVATVGINWCQISAGGYHTAAVKTDGTAWAWGWNQAGQLGNMTVGTALQPIALSGGGNTWCQISAGERHTAAVKTDGTTWTWGLNNCGQLGDGTFINRSSPGTLSGGGTTWCQISAGSLHTASVTSAGTAWTWGLNNCGQLGDGTVITRSSPVQVSGTNTLWCQISVNNLHTVAVKTTGTAFSWGSNSCGRLGDNTVTNRSSPVTVAGAFTTWCQICAGWEFTAAINKVNGLT